MSCGKPHATPCDEVLVHVYEFLDGELSVVDRERFAQHLEECMPCMREAGIEEEVKALVRRSCGSDPVPVDLRSKVLLKIRQVQVGVRYQS